MFFSRFFHIVPLMIAENLPSTFFDLLLVEGSFQELIRCAAPLAVPLH